MNSYLIKITEIQDNEMKMYKLVKGKGEGEWQKVNVEIGYFENGKWSIEGIGSLSSRIIKWEIKELYLQNNFSKTILQQIQHIVLTRLQILQLMVNNITSIESLNSMFLPSLTEITLSKNNINSIRLIRKCKWPNIKHLQLYNNPITDLSSLCHADIQKLKSFWVADIQPENSCFSIAEIIKTNTSKLKMIMISIRKSTRKKYIHDMVVNRFGIIRIFRTPEIDF